MEVSRLSDIRFRAEACVSCESVYLKTLGPFVTVCACVRAVEIRVCLGKQLKHKFNS